jgi:hypothetical protein
MSDVTSEKRIEGIWSGHVQGTNRGKILVRIERDANGLTAKAMLYDEQLGITEAWLSGQTSGDKTEFQLSSAFWTCTDSARFCRETVGSS